MDMETNTRTEAQRKLDALFKRGVRFGGKKGKSSSIRDIKLPPPAKPKDILRGTGVTQRALRSGFQEAEEAKLQDIDRARLDMLDKLGAIPDSLNTGIILDESQEEAVNNLSIAQYGCLVGPAGSGKTTTEKALIQALGIKEEEFTIDPVTVAGNRKDSRAMLAWKSRARIAICAYTGKAVQQTKRALPAWLHPYCDTSHGWLGYAPEFVEKMDADGEVRNVRQFRPTFTRFNKLDLDILLVDEAGMMPVYLWNQLMDALPARTRIYTIGDINQLAPVHGRSVLPFAMLKWPTFELQKIHRTEEGSIIDNAHRVLNGSKVVADKKTTAKRELHGSATKAAVEIVQILNHLHKKGSFDPLQDALIVPTNVGPLGQKELNAKLVRIFNPIREEYGMTINPRTAIKTARETVVYAVGDKVMLLKNNRERGLTNGQVGVVTAIVRNGSYQGTYIDDAIMENGGIDDMDFSFSDISALAAANVANVAADDEDLNSRAASHIMTVKFQDIEEPLELSSTGDFSGIALAYAMTCHKMQGSEARKVVVVVHSEHLRMLCREWYYTAITRAQEKLIILYTRRGEQQAVKAQRLKGKTLQEKALSFLDACGEDSLQPILREEK